MEAMMIGGTARRCASVWESNGDRRRGDALTSMLVGIVDKSVNVLAARLEGSVRVFKRVIQVDSDNIVDGDVRRVPTTFSQTAVHPVDVPVGAVCSREVL